MSSNPKHIQKATENEVTTLKSTPTIITPEKPPMSQSEIFEKKIAQIQDIQEMNVNLLRLRATLINLQEFSLSSSDSSYLSAELSIKDNNRKEFSTKNLVAIREVREFLITKVKEMIKNLTQKISTFEMTKI
jgi:hypothetical protein